MAHDRALNHLRACPPRRRAVRTKRGVSATDPDARPGPHGESLERAVKPVRPESLLNLSTGAELCPDRVRDPARWSAAGHRVHVLSAVVRRPVRGRVRDSAANGLATGHKSPLFPSLCPMRALDGLVDRVSQLLAEFFDRANPIGFGVNLSLRRLHLLQMLFRQVLAPREDDDTIVRTVKRPGRQAPGKHAHENVLGPDRVQGRGRRRGRAAASSGSSRRSIDSRNSTSACLNSRRIGARSGVRSASPPAAARAARLPDAANRDPGTNLAPTRTGCQRPAGHPVRTELARKHFFARG